MYRQMMGATLVLSLLVGCATPQLTPIRRDEPISIVFTESHKADGVSDIRNDDLAGDAKVGAGTGATGGAVAGVLIATGCGPFFIVCAPVLAAAGAVVGTATGAGVGAGVSIAGELSNEKAAQLRDRVGCVQQPHSLQAELQKNVTDRAQKYWKLGTDQSAALVTVELQDLMLSSKRDEQINCTIRVLVSVQRGVAKDSKTTEQKMYQYVAPTSSLSVWLDESNDFIDTVLTNASQQIATQIVSDLASKGTINQTSFTSERVESKTTTPGLRLPGPWSGKWSVQGSPVAAGVWALKQEGETVISTDESYHRIWGKALGDRLDGDVIRLAGSRRDPKLNLILSSDGKSFEGSIEDATGIKRISGIKVE
jgi:hypothetical protein